MAIDYTPAGPWADHVRALAMTESNEREDLIGDGGKAFGILQQHPQFFHDWYRADFPPFDLKPNDNWVTAQIKAAARFLEGYVELWGIDGAIQSYNLGPTAYRQGQRNANYLARWTENFQKVRGEHG